MFPAACPLLHSQWFFPTDVPRSKSPQRTMPAYGPMCIPIRAAMAWRSPKPLFALGRERPSVRCRVDAQRARHAAARSITACIGPDDTMISRRPSGCSGQPPYAICPRTSSATSAIRPRPCPLESCSTALPVAVAVTAACWSSSVPGYVLDAVLVVADTPLHGSADLPSGGGAVKQVGIFGAGCVSASGTRWCQGVRNLLLRLEWRSRSRRNCLANGRSCRTSSPPVRPRGAVLSREMEPSSSR